MKNKSLAFRRGVWALGVLVVVIAMALGTKVVSGEALQATVPVVFNSEEFGAEKFPEVMDTIIQNAQPLSEIAAALVADEGAAAAEYGVREGTGFPVFSVIFTAVAGTPDAGGFIPFTVEGVPGTITVRMQTGNPAITGTDLRDATGTIHFPDFVNQIEYQDAGVALNNELKKTVLANVVAADLAGKTLTVTGAFQLVNPSSYMITPVKIEVN